MIEVTKISTKGQIVIPLEIRKELGLERGTQVLITKVNDSILVKKMNLDLKKEFEELTKFGVEFAKKKGIKSEDDVARIIHKGRGIKGG